MAANVRSCSDRMTMRDEIISAIQQMASANGQAPGQKLFARETGIEAHVWRGKFWARWGDALVEAGYQPNEWTARLDTDEVLSGVVKACRHYGRLPTQDELAILRQTHPKIPTGKAIKRHFGSRDDLIEALRKRVADDPASADIAPLLPDRSQPSIRTVAAPKSAEGHVYLLKSGDHYKIGRSDELERRVKEIRIALPDKAVLLHSIRTDDPPGIEAYWHRRFSDKRANGEWFKLTTADVAAFQKRKFQ